jgi:hypothetical protein
LGHFIVVGEVLVRLLLGGYLGVDEEVLALPLKKGLHRVKAHTGVVFFPSVRLHRAG